MADLSAQATNAGGTANAGGAATSTSATSNASLPSPDTLDTDGDGVLDRDEIQRGSAPNNPDTDGDGVGDADDGWPLVKWLHPARLPDVRYAVVRLQSLGWPNTVRWAREIDDYGDVLSGPLSTNDPNSNSFNFKFWNARTSSMETTPWNVVFEGAPFQDPNSFPIKRLGRNGHVIGFINETAYPNLRRAVVWTSGAAAPTQLEFTGDSDSYIGSITSAVDGAGHVVGWKVEFTNDPDFYAAPSNWGGVMFGDAVSWLGGTHVTQTMFNNGYDVTNAGTDYGPVAINESGLIATSRQVIDYDSRRNPDEILTDPDVGILDGDTFISLGTGTITAITSGTPVVAVGYTQDNQMWWARQDSTSQAWLRETVQVWRPSTQQLEAIPNYSPSDTRINDRLEILVAGGNIVRNGVIRPLSDLMPSGWTNVGSKDINNHGVILADATPPDSPSGTQPEPILLVPASIQVDANRDGIIDDKDLAANSASKPFRFWVNDDVDRRGVTSGEETVQDDDDPTKSTYSNDKDWQRNIVPCERDLEDFSRLWINLSGLQSMLAATNSSIAVGLKWQNTNSTTPAIKIYPAYEPDEGGLYLTDLPTATQQIGLTVVKDASQSATATNPLIQPTSGDYDFVLPQSCLQNLTSTQSTLHLLFEGCKRGTGQLTLVVLKKDSGGNYTKIGDGPGTYFDIKNIKEMYERWTVGDGLGPGLSLSGSGGGGAPAASATISQDRLPAGATAGQYTAQSPERNQYILYVHGWNMHPWEKDAFAETAFKRLYWQGYKGRFGAFQWPTTYHTFAPAGLFDYDSGEYSSWLSATPLKNFLATLSSTYSGNVYVVAHSMGNVVTGEALRLAAQSGGRPVAAYVATQAAVPVHCYDPNQATPSDFFNSWRSPPGQSIISIYVGSATTPNIYPNWLASNGTAVGTRGNFYNPNDFALSRGAWETDQALKPDGETGLHWPYGFSGDPEIAPPQDRFFSTVQAPGHAGTAHHSLQLGSTTNVLDRYEIMAFAAQPRCRALGAVANPAGLSSSQSLQGMWPSPDPFNNNYKDHPWHSAEFRFTNMDQKKYWRTLLGANGFNLNSN
jgi:hypothetical protein